MSETLRITGMTCGHCARTVERAAGRVPGVENAHVDLENETLSFGGSASHASIAAAVRAVGYDIEEA